MPTDHVSPDPDIGTKRIEAAALAQDQAFTITHSCEGCDHTCGGRTIVHSLSRHGFGADWDLEAVLGFIATAVRIGWNDGVEGNRPGAHSLYVVGLEPAMFGKPGDAELNGYRFQVVRPS